jgi:membrane-associated phospholipid phosphatase
MNERRSFTALLPHEWCFGGFLLLTWLRLLAAVGPLDSSALLYLILIVTGTALTARCLAQPTKARWFARLWYYPVVMNINFPTMGDTALKLVSKRQDEFLQRLDAALVGITPSLRAEAIISPWLTELMSFCYFLFFPYLFISLLYYAWRGLPIFRQLIVGLFIVYGFGFLGYTILPAAGPYLAMKDQFTIPLTGFAITKLNAAVVAKGSNGVDVFPSLHCAVSCFLLGFDRQHARRRFLLYLLPCCGLWMATIYLRYHYLTDVLVGFALAALALRITGWWASRTEEDTQPDNFLTNLPHPTPNPNETNPKL